MGQEYPVIANDLNRFSSDINSYERSMQLAQQQLGKLLERYQMLQVQWEGEAQKVFLSSAAADLEEMSDVLSELNRILTDLRDAKNSYAACENEVDQLIRSLRV